MAQTIHLLSGDTVHDKVTVERGTLDRWMADGSMSDTGTVRRLFLASLERAPAEREVFSALAPVRSGGSVARRQAFEDTLWATLNS